MPTVPKMKRPFSLLLDSKSQLEFLLPNGLLLSLELDSDLNLLEAKEELWLSAKKEPLFNVLQPSTHYVFCGINRETADEEEYYDQTLRLRELPLLLPYLRVVEATKDSQSLETNKINATISSCIGISQMDLARASQLNLEIKWSRPRLQRLAKEHSKALSCNGTLGVAQYLTSAPQRAISKSLENQLSTLDSLEISAWVLAGDDQACQEVPILVTVDPRATVLAALTELLKLQTEIAQTNHAAAIRHLGVTIQPPNARDYALKVCCSQAYLFDLEKLLISYEYVQQCVEQHRKPCLSPVLRKDVCETLECSLTDLNGWGISTILDGKCGIDSDHVPGLPPHVTRRTARLFESGDRTVKSVPHTELNTCDAVEQLDRVSDDQAGLSDDEWLESTPITTYNSISVDSPLSANRLASKRVPPSPEVSLWDLNGYLSIKVCSGQFLSETLSLTGSGAAVTNLSSSVGNPIPGAPSDYVVRVGLFHGTQSLIEYQNTSGRYGPYFPWNEWLYFHIKLSDIPPAARLCVALIELKRRSVKTYEYPVGWANLNFFSPLGYVISGNITLRLWPASLSQSTEERFHRLHPSGTVLQNPNPDFVLQLMIHSPVQGRIRRPSLRTYLNAYCGSPGSELQNGPNPSSLTQCRSYRAVPSNQLSSKSLTGMTFTNPVFGTGDVEEEDVDEFQLIDMFPGHPIAIEADFHEYVPVLEELANRDPLYELSEQEKAALWCGRYYCRKYLPELLPWLVQSVCWYRRASVAEFYALLQDWPRPLQVSVALQLLGAMGLNASGATEPGSMLGTAVAVTHTGRGGASGVADPHVRALAVHSLSNLDDSELSDYLLQLVQALKAEAYPDNALSRFILHRALHNPMQIGLRFFWHLRSEIHLPDIRLQFGILLEAFCLGCGPLLSILANQVTALNCLETISARLKTLPNEDEQRIQFRDEILQPEARKDLQWFPSPLCLSERLGKLLVDKCDVKRSKKRPLWLVWTNSDRLSAHHHRTYQAIFKHGDDLRQDMLTLNLLRVMDRIWKEEGLDMCLVPYACLATGPEMGLIEAVRNARTVMSIQNDKLLAALQINSTQLYRWLAQGHNAGPDQRTIQNFVRSCAGYCVATFVLGIRDRHPDNIMVDTSGRLFHIDFGHILDNRKKKFGIIRERVPFVLTKDFTEVIARGNVRFEEFTDLCEKAYAVLRKHSNLLLTLFAMMLPSGLPELTSVSDLEYVRKTLAVDMTHEKALNYFQSKFNEAYNGAWTTKFDWFSHWVNT